QRLVAELVTGDEEDPPRLFHALSVRLGGTLWGAGKPHEEDSSHARQDHRSAERSVPGRGGCRAVRPDRRESGHDREAEGRAVPVRPLELEADVRRDPQQGRLPGVGAREEVGGDVAATAAGSPARRLLLFVPTLVGASILIFVLLRLVPGDIAEILVYQTGSEASAIQQKQIRQIRAELGLDRPVVVQYLDWLGGALRGDFGRSYMQKRPVADILRERVPRSLELALLTILIALAWAVPLGVVSAVRQNTWADYLVRVLSISGLSLPIFFTGVLVLYLLVRLFGWLPPLEFVSFTVSPLENLKQLL